MCHPNYLAQLSRRHFITACVAGAGAACLSNTSQASNKSASLSHIQFQNIVDLTHTLTPEFPTFSGQPQFEMESLADVVFEGKTIREEDAARFLLEAREIKGIMTDTLSLDAGVNSRTFPVHDAWLPANRWGVECVANLSSLPAKGATVVVGGPKVKGASGGPCRIIAFV